MHVTYILSRPPCIYLHSCYTNSDHLIHYSLQTEILVQPGNDSCFRFFLFDVFEFSIFTVDQGLFVMIFLQVWYFCYFISCYKFHLQKLIIRVK